MKFFTSFFSITIIAIMLISAIPVSTAEAACDYTGSNPAGYRCSPRATTYQTSQNTQYQYQSTASLEAYIAQLIALLEQLQSIQSGGTNYTYTYTNAYTNYSRGSDVDVETRSARDIDDEDAVLRGEVDFNNEDEATVWFEYGRTRSNLNEDTTHVVLDEDDDDESFTAKINDLRDETTYYFRAVAEDEDGDRDYGNIENFKTDDNNNRRRNDDDPEVDTDNATNITDDSARLRGDVDMNDFRNGLVFFVYGEDENQIEYIEDDYDEYRDIDEDGDGLQKVRVDSDLDGDANYHANVWGLDDNTDIYFTLCVEYEDEDDDETIICGKVEDFETDN